MTPVVRASELLAGMTMEVRIVGPACWRPRVWLAALLIRAAALVVGCGVDVRLS